MSIYIAGHQGMVGSAIMRELLRSGIPANAIITRSHATLDLTQTSAVQKFFAETKPQEVYLAAARVGGIHANNTYPADFLYDNLMIAANVIHAAFVAGVRKLLFLGSSCIYPKFANQPMREDALLTGLLEPTNEPYAIAKITGIKLCESYNRQYQVDYRSVMPTNLYGIGDSYHPENAHVIPALIARFHHAKIQHSKTVMVWGDGSQRREFLYVDDLASACVHVMQLEQSDYAQHTAPMCSHINVGTGEDVSIAELSALIAEVVEYEGLIEFDVSKPSGAPRKLLDTRLIEQLGWQPSTNLKTGLAMAYQDFLNRKIKI